jgi:hypothetical protein
VRVASFRTRMPTGPLRAVTNVNGVMLRKVSRLEVATFLVDVLEQYRYVRQPVFRGHH